MHARRWILALASLAGIILAGCGGGDTPLPTASLDGEAAPPAAVNPVEEFPVSAAPPAPAARRQPIENLFPEVLIKTSHGEIRVRLDAAKAPVTVDNFLANYVRRGFYAGTIVHYVDPDKFWIAGGYDAEFAPLDPRAPILNEATNGLKNKRGTIAMVRDPEYAQSATSQFFINLADNDFLDHVSNEDSESYGYCVFGEVISGLEVVDAIARVATHDREDFVATPVEPVVIESIEQVK